MARPKGSKSDPIGKIFVRLEQDMEYVTMRYKKARKAYVKMMAEKRLNKKMGL